MSPEPQPQGRFVEIGGARVHLEAWGDTAAPALLCLHGLGGGTHFFSALGAALAARASANADVDAHAHACVDVDADADADADAGKDADAGASARTIAFDLPGSGLSPLLADDARPSSISAARLGLPAALPKAARETRESRETEFSFDAVADLIVALARSEQVTSGGAPLSDKAGDAAPADQAGPTAPSQAGKAGRAGQPFFLLGHSMGAILALEVIRRAPDLIAGLIIVGGLPEPLDSSRTRIRGRAEAIRQNGIVAGMGADVVAANFSRRSQLERRELTAGFARLFDRQDPAGYVATAEALAAWTARDLPPLDHLPCLVVSGEEDRYAPPDAIQAFARTLPASTRVAIMPECGHLPFLEQPAAFAAIVSSFLRDCRGASTASAP